MRLFTFRRTLHALCGAAIIVCVFSVPTATQNCDWGQATLYTNEWYDPGQELWGVYAEGTDLASGCCIHLYGTAIAAETAAGSYYAEGETAAELIEALDGGGSVEGEAAYIVGCLCANAVVANPVVPVSLQLPDPTISLSSSNQREAAKPLHILALKDTEDVVLNATLTPSGANPAMITWSGGIPGSSNLQRRLQTGTVGTFEVSASIPGQTILFTIHVIDATTPEASQVNASKDHDFGGWEGPVVGCGNECFGWVYLRAISQPSVARPEYSVLPYFSGDRWVFRLEWVRHFYYWGWRDPNFRIDLPVGNLSPFPLAEPLDEWGSRDQAREDFRTNTPIAPLIGPSRTRYWARWVTVFHETFHKDDFYTNYWRPAMDAFESTAIEQDGHMDVDVVFNCLIPATMTGTAAKAFRTPAWDATITTYHETAYGIYAAMDGSELRAHGASNPEYETIRSQIP